MPNPYFQFKQFTIQQDRCAMKVCTDACLFGAWVANLFEDMQPEKILDIGTGTGLLTLMLAQKLHGLIDTIEIDQDAYSQAVDNIAATPWKERLRAVNDDVRTYQSSDLYDLVISNPPFYEKDLRSPVTVSNMARHDETLRLEELLSRVGQILEENGSFATLIPHHRLNYFKDLASKQGLFPFAVANVRQSSTHDFFRSMIILKKYFTTNISEEKLVIKDTTNYTAEFKALLKDYYYYL